MNKVLQNKRGTSLVEVLVVMVVLLVGIMTVIQMFPTGFGIVKAAESRTIATRLAQQELERWKAMSANLPTGIIPIKEDGTFFADNTAYSAEIRNKCVLAGPPFGEFMTVDDVLERGNVLNIRQVIGETTSIPAPGYFQTGSGTEFGSKYTLAFSPIDVYTDDNGLNGLSIKSGPLQRAVGSVTYLPSIKRGQYSIVYTSGSSEFYVSFPRESSSIDRFYYISYSYWAVPTGTTDSDPTLISVLDQRVPDSGTISGDDVSFQTVTITPPSGYDVVGIQESSDTCARGFSLLGESDPWTSDPYTYKLSDSILGIISFNPNAQDRYEYTAYGKRPIEASIDYRIYDPRIIREDKVIPDVSDNAERIPIKLALRFILNAGAPSDITDGDPTDNPDEPTFEGLMRQYNGRPQLGRKITISDDLTIKYSMLIVDLKTGLRVGVPESSGSGTGVPLYTSDFVDYKTGVVNLPGPAAASDDRACLIDYSNNIIVKNVDLRGRNLRFLYRADGDWSVQCNKAYANYSRVYEPSSVEYDKYCLVDSNRLLFAPCDAGKTVSVDYTYVTTSDNVEHRVVGRACQISDTASDVSDQNGCYYVDIKVPATNYTITRVSVIGTSFIARVIWRDGKHWRHVDLDTNLVRGE
ncbi:hypothetical protein LLG46_04055 [bacterium]|nr:hypothetical protein [bacterium]